MKIRNNTLLSKCAFPMVYHCQNRPVVDFVCNESVRYPTVLVLTLPDVTGFTGREIEKVHIIHLSPSVTTST